MKWHQAHTTWFFETFVLRPLLPDYRPFREEFRWLFNSYYNSLGEQAPEKHLRASFSRLRATYRNFFPPSMRWQFTGIRLAA